MPPRASAPATRDLWRALGALTAALLGVALAFPAHGFVVDQIGAGVRAYGVFDSASAGGFPAFLDNRDPSSGAVILSVTLFNVTNPAAVLRGARPLLAPVGPLRYTLVLTRHNVAWPAGGGEIVYQQYQRFFPTDAATRALEGARVTQLNTLLAGALAQGPLVDALLPALERVWEGDGGAFVSRSAAELIWGYNDSALLWQRWPGLQRNDSSLAAALAAKGHVRAVTGAGAGAGRAAEYLEWAGDSQLTCCAGGVRGIDAGANASGGCAPQYAGYDARAIRGSFGAAFHAGVRADETLTLATYDFGTYRSWPLVCAPAAGGAAGAGSLYDASPLTAGVGACESYDVEGVRLSRFRVPAWALGNASVAGAAAEAAAYGIAGPSGVVDMSACYFKAPILISKSHFLDASDELRNGVEGLAAPDFAAHGSWLGVEPVTGRVLDFNFRVGINARFAPTTVEGLFGAAWTFFAGVTPAVVPLAAIELGSTMTAAQGADFRGKVYGPLRAAAGVRWAGAALAGAGALAAAALAARAAARARADARRAAAAAGLFAEAEADYDALDEGAAGKGLGLN